MCVICIGNWDQFSSMTKSFDCKCVIKLAPSPTLFVWKTMLPITKPIIRIWLVVWRMNIKLWVQATHRVLWTMLLNNLKSYSRSINIDKIMDINFSFCVKLYVHIVFRRHHFRVFIECCKQPAIVQVLIYGLSQDFYNNTQRCQDVRAPRICKTPL